MEAVDKATEIRKGEELDVEIIKNFIAQYVPDFNNKITIKQFPSGFSNLTYLLKTDTKEFILRRAPFGKKAKSAHDMLREYNVLKALKPHYSYCPEPIAYCDDASIMDTPFYIMERLNGIILRKDFPEGMNLTSNESKTLSENLIKVLYKLHSIDYKAIGLEDLGKPEGYVKRQIEGWSKRFVNAKTEDAPDFEEVMLWLKEKMPADTDKPCIIHNDYKFDNVVLNPDNPMEIIGVLDWEMTTIGDPFMDLGSSMAYWINKDDPDFYQHMRMMPTNVDGMLTRDGLINLYGELSGNSVDSFDYYYCFGLFRLAVIAQQIYYRYFHGQTKDKRFKLLIGGVKLLEKMALDVIEKSGL